MEIVKFTSFRLCWLIYKVPVILFFLRAPYDDYIEGGPFLGLRSLLTLGGLFGGLFYSIGARVLTRKFWQIYFICMLADELYELFFGGSYGNKRLVAAILCNLQAFVILFLYSFHTTT